MLGGKLGAGLAVALLVAAGCSDGDGDDPFVTGAPPKRIRQLDVDRSDCGVDPTAEIEGDTLHLVSSYPQSGGVAPLGHVAVGWQAYFEMVNEAGGVAIAGDEYEIDWEVLDDGYDPARTAQNITELVGDGEDVFAAFGVAGTTNNLAIRDQLDQLCVPNLFPASGSPAWGNPEYPWMLGSSLPAYSLEAEVFVRLLEQQKPDAKVALLVQDDDFGQAYELGVRQAVVGTGIEVVAVRRYSPVTVDVAQPVAELAASGADVFFDGATLLPCPAALQQAEAVGWVRTLTWVSSTCLSPVLLTAAGPSAGGIYSTANLKDPASPIWDDDEAMRKYREVVAERFPDVEAGDGLVAFGWTQAAIFVQGLEQATAPTRKAVVESLRSLDLDDGVGLLLPGTGVRTGPGDLYLGERVSVVQYNVAAEGNHFLLVGDPYSFEGQTFDLTPTDLIV